tara:strand:+ start:10313 stop:10876 length:564 start_codon:yes stop_codon:yes gene_type:complete
MKKSIPMAIALASTLPLLAYAQEQTDVGAVVSLNQSIIVNNVTSLDFGTLQFQVNALGGVVTLNTDGSGDVGTSEYIQSGSFQAGGFDLAMEAGETVIISCLSQANVALDTDSSLVLDLNNVKYSQNGIESTCGALIPTFLATTTTAPVSFSIGADLNVSDGALAVAGSYSTSNAGGTPISFTISYN